MFEAVVFDLDGVIVDSEVYHYQSIKQALAPHKLDLTYEDFRNDYTGGSDRSTITRICLAFCIAFDDAQLDTWRAIKADVYKTLIREELQPLPGAANLIRSVADELPIGLATGSRRSDLEAVFAYLEKGRLRERFKVTVSADDVTNPKPHLETYRAAVTKLGFEPKQCIAIEDTPGGIASAKGAGLRVLAVAGTHDPTKLAGADRVVPTLDGLSLQDLKKWF